jgi:aminoglycoside phosphotransferase (APT) family kinase protein
METPPPGLGLALRQSLAREFAGARDPILDRMTAVSSELWRFRFRWREEDGSLHAAHLVARLCARPEDCNREARALELAAETGLRVPSVWATDPHLIVDWIEGETFAAAWRRRDERAAPALLADVLAELHDRTERPVRGRDPVVGRLSALGDDARRLGDEELAGEVATLRRDRPPAASTAVCHGDFRPENVLMRGPTLIGWQDGSVGDPRLDLARATLYMADEFGGALRTPFLSAYRGRRSISPDELAWFERLAALERRLRAPATAT